MSQTVQETKTQRIQRLKREKNAWECLDEIRAFASNGHLSIPPEWLGTYFRFWGVYTQGDGVGAVGGTGGREGASVFHGTHPHSQWTVLPTKSAPLPGG